MNTFITSDEGRQIVEDSITTVGDKITSVAQSTLSAFDAVHQTRDESLDAAEALMAQSEEQVSLLLGATRGVTDSLPYEIEDSIVGLETTVRDEVLDGVDARERLQEMISIANLVNVTLYNVSNVVDAQWPILDMLLSTQEITAICAWNISKEAPAPALSGIQTAVNEVDTMLEDVYGDMDAMSELAQLEQCVYDASCSTDLMVKMMKLQVRLRRLRKTLLGFTTYDDDLVAFATSSVDKQDC